MGIPATGRQVSWTGNHIYRIANGRIAEAWSEVSLYELLSQLTETA
jgi:predicted ester cyclase